MNQQRERLWDKGGSLDDVIHRFTVGDDPHWDRYLVHWDCLGSAAHVRTLERGGWLSAADARALLDGLAKVDALDRDGAFEIPEHLEDCHTAIEAFLTSECGEAGGRVHTGRSRNDQVATAMRLFLRDRVFRWIGLLDDFVGAALARIERDGAVAMPGYTHLQPAMPSSVGQWLHASSEAALEQIRAALDLLDRLDACPLGTGAGFGVPLELDRAYTAKLLGFSRVQRSPIDVQNSRGRMETYFVRVAADIGALLEKLAWDMILFSTAEFGFLTLPAEMTTGSSIMPQKRNPDVLELLRARAARLTAREFELRAVRGKLPSSYHRDLQLTKAPAIQASLETEDMLRVATRVVERFELNRDRLAAAMRPELYATQAAVDLVRKGVPFRDAYRRVAGELASGVSTTETGGSGHAGQAVQADTLLLVRNETAELIRRAAERKSAIEAPVGALLPPA